MASESEATLETLPSHLVQQIVGFLKPKDAHRAAVACTALRDAVRARHPDLSTSASYLAGGGRYRHEYDTLEAVLRAKDKEYKEKCLQMGIHDLDKNPANPLPRGMSSPYGLAWRSLSDARMYLQEGRLVHAMGTLNSRLRMGCFRVWHRPADRALRAMGSRYAAVRAVRTESVAVDMLREEALGDLVMDVVIRAARRVLKMDHLEKLERRGSLAHLEDSIPWFMYLRANVCSTVEEPGLSPLRRRDPDSWD